MLDELREIDKLSLLISQGEPLISLVPGGTKLIKHPLEMSQLIFGSRVKQK